MVVVSSCGNIFRKGGYNSFLSSPSRSLDLILDLHLDFTCKVTEVSFDPELVSGFPAPIYQFSSAVASSRQISFEISSSIFIYFSCLNGRNHFHPNTKSYRCTLCW